MAKITIQQERGNVGAGGQVGPGAIDASGIGSAINSYGQAQANARQTLGNQQVQAGNAIANTYSMVDKMLQQNASTIQQSANVEANALRGLSESIQPMPVSNLVQSKMNQYSDRAMQSVRTANYADKMSSATLEYQKALSVMDQNRLDDKGNPTFIDLPQRTDKTGKDIMNKYLSSIEDEEVKSQFQANFTHYINGQIIDSLGKSHQQGSQYFQESLDKSSSVLADQASTGSLQQAAYAQSEFEKILNSGVDSGAITPAQRQRSIDGFRGYVASNRTSSFIKADPVGALSVLSQEGPVEIIPGIQLTESERQRFVNQANSDVAALQAKQEAEVRANFERVTKLYNAASDVIHKGGVLPVETLSTIGTAFKGTPYEPYAQSLLQKYQMSSQFSRLDPLSRAQIVTAYPRGSESNEFLSGVDDNIQRSIEKDSFGFAISQGLITSDDVQPLDFSQDLSSQLSARHNAMDVIEAHYGVKSSGLTNDEINAVSQQIQNQPAINRAALIGQIVSGLGNDAAGEVFKKLSQNQATGLAFAGNLAANGQPEVATRIFTGQDALKAQPGIIKEDKDFKSVLGGLLPDYGIPEQRRDVAEAIKNIYASLSVEAMDYSGEINADRLKQATELVTNGSPIEYDSTDSWFGRNNVKIESPVPGWTADDFKGWLKTITDDDIMRAGGFLGMENGMSEVLQKAKLVTVGRGRYIAQIEQNGEYRTVMMADGSSPFILDYNQQTNKGSDLPSVSSMQLFNQLRRLTLKQSQEMLQTVNIDQPLEGIAANIDTPLKYMGDNEIIPSIAAPTLTASAKKFIATAPQIINPNVSPQALKDMLSGPMSDVKKPAKYKSTAIKGLPK